MFSGAQLSVLKDNCPPSKYWISSTGLLGCQGNYLASYWVPTYHRGFRFYKPTFWWLIEWDLHDWKPELIKMTIHSALTRIPDKRRNVFRKKTKVFRSDSELKQVPCPSRQGPGLPLLHTGPRQQGPGPPLLHTGPRRQGPRLPLLSTILVPCTQS